jgi:4-amino-4-deoxy-L-arabinose transferase-like glycosyltransferase
MAGVLAFVVVGTGILLSGSWRGDFRVDEAHKISETAFLGLWLRGDAGNTAWFANIIDRTNPPAGKYAFGLAILLSGQELPSLPTLAVHSPDGNIPATHAEALSAPYRPLLTATRSVSGVATALTAALLMVVLARYHGWVSAVAACAFFSLNFLTRDYAATAVFDPLFTLFFTACLALTAAASARRVMTPAVLIGIVTALAFQTRLNGLLAFVLAMPFLWMASRRVKALAIAAAVFIAITLVLNPFYWSTGAVPPFSSHNGPLRPVERLLQQKQDLERLAAPLQEGRTEGRGLSGKVRYLFEMVLSDRSGVLLMLGAVTGAVFLAVRWRLLQPPMRIALLMSLAVIATMVATLPLPWPRYLLVVIPPLALLAGYGTGEMVNMAVQRTTRKRFDSRQPQLARK